MAEITARLSTALARRYRILQHVGEGGMATVYLAEDLKHDRKVAVKVLRPELAAVLGAERFVQEIKTTASLQHPHILPLFDSGEADSFLYYVMPYIEGETLRDKLNRETQLGIEEAVRIATEVADALDYAHRHNVIHRDIKPENILLHDGRPMVADFGIALAVSAAAGGRMTETGLSLGTPHYMSPEQATADKDITNRSDIYSLGSVLYEMLAGEPPHMGNSAQQIIMKIVTEAAQPVASLRKTVPANVSAAVVKALEKLPADRFESAKAFSDALGNPAFALTATSIDVPVTTVKSQGPALMLLSIAAVVATAAAVLFALGGRSEGNDRVVVSSLMPPPGEDFSERESFGALSPDGTRFAFVTISARGERRLWVRRMDTLTAEPIGDVDDVSAPFWSPDGESLAFFAGGRLMRLDLGSGATRILCETPTGFAGAWSEDDLIVFGSARGLERTSAAGDACEVAIARDSSTYRWGHPSFLPGGGRVLMERFFRTEDLGVLDRSVVIGDLESGRVQTLLEQASSPTYMSSGHVVYGRRNTFGVFAQRMGGDGSRLEGEAVAIAGPVRTAGGTFAYSVSNEGTLVYLPSLGDREKLLVNRRGEIVDTLRQGGTWTHRYARDHEWVAMADGGTMWLYDVGQDLASRLVTTQEAEGVWPLSPVWAPSDSAVVFGAINCGLGIVRIEDRSVRTIDADEQFCGPVTDWSRDGRYLIGSPNTPLPYNESAGLAAYDLVNQQIVTMATPPDAAEGTLSPDMRWLAYVSFETGGAEIYVRPFLRAGRPVRISPDGGRHPRLRSDGRELFYETPDGRVMASPVTPGAEFRASGAEMLFRAPGWTRPLFFDSGTPYDVSPDGQQFVLRLTAAASSAVLVQNWLAKLR